MKPMDQTQTINLPSAQKDVTQNDLAQNGIAQNDFAQNDFTQNSIEQNDFTQNNFAQNVSSQETAMPETDQPQHAFEPLADGEAARLPEDSPIHQWFFTFMCINIPFAGWIYLIYLAFSKKRTERRNFARAYLFYKLLFLMISIILLGIVVYISLDIVDQLLAYMEML